MESVHVSSPSKGSRFVDEPEQESFHSCLSIEERFENESPQTQVAVENAASPIKATPYQVQVTTPTVAHKQGTKPRRRVVLDDDSSDDENEKEVEKLSSVLEKLSTGKKHRTPLRAITNMPSSSPASRCSKKPTKIYDTVVDGVSYSISFEGMENVKDSPVTRTFDRSNNQGLDIDGVHGNQNAEQTEENQSEVLAELSTKAETLAWNRKSSYWEIASSSLYFRLPGKVGDTLYDYQREGVSFILTVWSSSIHGGVLADDMGMGKTNQSVAALASLFYSNLIQNALVVTPLAVLDKWRALMSSQITGNCGIPVLVFHGNRKDAVLNSFISRGKSGIILTTYETCQARAESLAKVKWGAMVADEGSRIKNYKSQLFKSLRVLASTAERRLVITGTPFENSLQEMWSIFDFACDGALFGPLEKFNRVFAHKIEQSQIRGTSNHSRIMGTKLGHALSKAIQPFILRREKTILQESLRKFGNEQHMQSAEKSTNEIPDSNVASDSSKAAAAVTTESAAATGSVRTEFNVKKIDLIVWTVLSEAQRAMYRLFLESDDVSRALNQTQSPLAALTVLKKICDDTRLASGNNAGKHLSNEEPSNKLQVLNALIKDLAVDGGHKMVVFSHSKAMLGFIEQAIQARFRKGVRYIRVDGDMKIKDRMARIKAFNRDEPLDEEESDSNDCDKWDILLLTSGVGALGIEVTGADRVVIFDPHWNPAVDDQAIDRAFRIGQKNHVVSYRLVTVGTVEEKIMRIQLRKVALARTIFNLETQRAYSSQDDLKDLFALPDETSTNTLFRLIEETATETLEESVRKRLDETADEKSKTQILSHVQAFVSQSEVESDFDVRRLLVSKVIAGCSDRTGLFGREDAAQLEEAVRRLTLEEKEETVKTVEDALGWLSVKNKRRPLTHNT